MDAESKLALEADYPEVDAFVIERGSAIEPDPETQGVYWLSTRPLGHPADQYFIRIAWTVYPHAAPSIRFATSVGGGLGQTNAWPNIPGYRPGNFDICKPISAEAFAIHSDWRSGPHAWIPDGNPFLHVVQTLQTDLDFHYQGRSA
jgi:hypothetical protein